MIHMSAKEYQQFIAGNATKKTSKHRNKHVYIYEDGFCANEKLDGHGAIVAKYDSVKEYKRHKELELLQRAGKISGLESQVRFLLQDGFVDGAGKKHQPSYYQADFVYIENGKKIVEDVKGIDKKTGKPQTTATFRLKWKMLQARYPECVCKIY